MSPGWSIRPEAYYMNRKPQKPFVGKAGDKLGHAALLRVAREQHRANSIKLQLRH